MVFRDPDYPMSPDAAALVIARRLNSWFTIISSDMGPYATVEGVAPLVKRMIENNWDELSRAAHIIRRADEKAMRELDRRRVIDDDYRPTDFSGWM